MDEELKISKQDRELLYKLMELPAAQKIICQLRGHLTDYSNEESMVSGRAWCARCNTFLEWKSPTKH